MSWIPTSRQQGISSLGILVSCSGANPPTTWVFLVYGRRLGHGVRIAREITRLEREREMRGSIAARGASKPIAVDVPVPLAGPKSLAPSFTIYFVRQIKP